MTGFGVQMGVGFVGLGLLLAYKGVRQTRDPMPLFRSAFASRRAISNEKHATVLRGVGWLLVLCGVAAIAFGGLLVSSGS